MALLLQSDTPIEVVGETDVGWASVREAKMLRPDVVVMDRITPGLSVLDLIKGLVEDVAGVAVVLLTDDLLARLQRSVVREPYATLSTREREALPLLAEGGTNHEIAKTINVSPYTVATYRKRIMRKLDLHSRAEIRR